VDLIVSKWEVMFQSPTVELVDITSQLVQLFQPTEKGLKWIKDMQNIAPIPMDKLPTHLN
jgi:hypothetical protein